MSTVQSLITRIQRDYAPKIGRTLILNYLNTAVSQLYDQDCAQTTFYNTSDATFPFPLLSTTAGTLEYEITAANLVDSTGTAVTLAVNGTTVAARRVKRVMVSASAMRTGQYTPQFRGESINLTGINPYWKGTLYYNNYSKVVGVPVDKSETQNAKFVFLEDPGTTTDTFYVEFYIEHPTLDAETDSLLFDQRGWEQALIDGVVGMIEDYQHGESQRMNRFLTYWVPKFAGDMNRGLSDRRPSKFPIREML